MNRNKTPWLLLIIATAMVFFEACKDPNETGIGVIPDDDLITANYLDTFSIEMQTLIVDSALTGHLDQVMFGNVVDPEFGRIEAGAYIQFSLPGNNVNFGDTSKLELDSIYLEMDLFNVFGRFEGPMQIEIFEVIDPTFSDSILYDSRDQLMVDFSRDLANGFTLDFSGFAGIFNVTVPLDPYLGNKILFAPTDSLTSDEVFREYFKGLYIRGVAAPTNTKGSGAVYYLDVTSGGTTISLDYKNDSIERSYALVMEDDAGWFHSITRSETSDKLLGLEQPNSSDPNAIYQFIQQGAQINMALQVPHLESLNPAGINRAELEIKVNPAYLGSSDRYSPPNVLYAYLADSTGIGYADSVNFVSFATYNSASRSYVLPLSNITMQMINGDLANNGFILKPGEQDFEGENLNRAVIGGVGHPTLAPKFRVTYTTLPQ